MKILNKIKKIFTAMIMGIVGIYTRVSALPPDPLYGPSKTEIEPSLWEKIFNVSKYLIVPIILIIGLIMYLNKKSSKGVKKIGKVLIVTSIAIMIVVLLYIISKNM